MKAVVIASGGMDSATLAYHYASLGYELHLVGFNYGQRHSKELDSLVLIARQLNAKCSVVDLETLKTHLSGSSLTSDDIAVPDGHYAEETMRITVVPNRNLIMLSVAAGIAVSEGADVLATGVHAGDHFIYPDCRPEFIDAARAAIQLGTEGHCAEGFTLEAPFVNKTKADIAAYGHELNVMFETTWSCYKGGDIHCGTCGTCYERHEAFIDAGVTDPTVYLNTPDALVQRALRTESNDEQ